MRNDLTKTVIGSLEHESQKTGKDVAELLMNVDHMIVVDTSASMSARDAGNGSEQRHDVAQRELESLQKDLPGKIAVISGSYEAIFCPSGIPQRQDGGTNFNSWLKFIKPFDGTEIKFYIISDGEDYSDMAIKLAETFETPIHCIFVGPDRESASGIKWLKKISDASNGKTLKSASTAEFQTEFRALAAGNGA